VYKIANKAGWLGEVEAPDEGGAIKTGHEADGHTAMNPPQRRNHPR
jgi:hypothetical protein